ncbi:FkbM family methyltransferase [Bdellovibrio sp. HCB185ZH]|uniref:FkbM family methyltransferase n=1 Tax=Bdellovibrio sp. HCB185ZH TaxID=3394235 RepID=UPI0039A59E07
MKYYGQFEPPTDRFIYDRYFKYYQEPGTFIECGAFDGITDSCCYLLEQFFHWKGLNVEPSPYSYAELAKNRPHSNNLNRALSNERGHVSFNIVLHPVLGKAFGNSSISHTEAHMADLKNQGCTFEETKVETVTYDDIIRLSRIEKLDLFVLDVEGHEFKVLDSMIQSDSRIFPNVLVVEHGHLGVQPLREIIEPLGYIYDTSMHANSFFVKKGAPTEILKALIEADQQTDLTRLIDEIKYLNNSIDAFKNSISWKVTAPLRNIRRILRF